MTQLQHDLKRFYFRLSLRTASYAALWGLVLALPIVIAAPWLRDWYGFPGYYATMAIPVILPAFYAFMVLFVKPPEREQVLAADHWFGRTGTIVSAYELERTRPDDPFVEPMSRQARDLMHDRPLPEPRWLRRALIALAVLLLLTPLSRWAHAQMEDKRKEDEKEQRARQPEVKREDAEKIAQSAGQTAEEAKKAGATQQEKLANDLEDAARRAQAKADDKERALRNANSLVDRAKAQVDGQRDRQDARDSMKNNDATKELAEAIESNDPKRIEEAIKKATEQVYKKDGTVDEKAAAEIKAAIEKARQKAPEDATMKRAAEALEESLDKARKDGESGENKQAKAEESLRKRMEKNGAGEEEIKQALEELRNQAGEQRKIDEKAMRAAMVELSKAMDTKRDMDPSGRRAEELREKLEKGEITPEEAKEMVELARELSKKMEVDAETLREMIRQGKEFPGMEKAAREMVEKAKREGSEIRPEDVPQWVKDAVGDELKKMAGEKRPGEGKPGEGKPGEGKPGEGKPGEGKPGEGKPEGSGNPDGSTGKDTGHKPNDGSTKPIEGAEGRKEGVDTQDTGKGEKDPNGEKKDLDLKKAAEEKAAREMTGRKGGSEDINTKEELDRLPRRYRDAARKYFERKDK